MPTTFKKKTRKYRGKRTFGYGKIGAHRAKGQRGGTGTTTGIFKHKWSYYQKQKALGFPDPQWKIGKHGFVMPPEIQRRKKINAINIKDVERLLDKWVEAGKATLKGKKYQVNLDELNYQKLLGTGKVTKSMEITVKYASEKAKEKLAEAKCKLTLLAKE